MSDGNIIKPYSFNTKIDKWSETPAEKQLRIKGYCASEKGIIETGITTSASELRKSNAPALLGKVARALQKVCEQMSDLRWDDDKVCLSVGIQVRNNWVEVDGEWLEEGSEEWMRATVNKATKREL